jgi:hypothetical protein
MRTFWEQPFAASEIAELFNSVGFVEMPGEKVVPRMAPSAQTETESNTDKVLEGDCLRMEGNLM